MDEDVREGAGFFAILTGREGVSKASPQSSSAASRIHLILFVENHTKHCSPSSTILVAPGFGELGYLLLE